MNVLILNSGSSSLKFKVIDPGNEKLMLKGNIDGIGLPTCKFKYSFEGASSETARKIRDHHEAVERVIDNIRKFIGLENINAIGHRVVHGGEYYSFPTLISQTVITRIKELCDLAPLHNPPNLDGILACRKLLPRVPQVAVFDTAFHQTMPEHSFLYAIPYDYYKKFKIRKYGFHGTSHKYVSQVAARMLKKSRPNLVTCHLGNGSSIACIKDGKSIDTTMGFTPLQGLIMGTRSGDIDPEIVEFLSRRLKSGSHDIIRILNKESGLKGICGYSDVRTIHEKAQKGNNKCQLALDMFAYRITQYIGAYIAALPDVDAIVFTAGIGQGAFYIRKKICNMLGNLGIRIDMKKNRANCDLEIPGDITARGSKIKVFVIPTNEELMIAKETQKVVRKKR